MGGSRIDIAREIYEAFATGDRDVLEQRLSKEFKFSAPPDPLLDRDGYFERCWPGAGSNQSFDFKRLVALAGRRPERKASLHGPHR